MAGVKDTGQSPSQTLSYQPYVSPDQDMRELSVRAVVLGAVLAIVLGAANAYLGLVAGMTVAATFPAAVIAMAALRPFKGTILEENMARTTGAVGEALAAGAIFTIPAFLIAGVWSRFDFFRSTILMLVGGLLGVLFIIIVRRTLVEDATLPFPESRACAELVKAGQGGETGARYVFGAMALGAVIEFLKNPNGLKLIKPYVKGVLSLGHSKITYLTGEGSVLQEVGKQGRMLVESPAASGALVGVGYIIGPKLASLTFSGGVFGWLFLMPLVLFMSPDALDMVQAGKGSWVDVASSVYNAQVKPVAVGAMLVGAFYTLYRMRKNLIAGVRRSVADMRAAGEGNRVLRTDKDIPLGTVLILIAALLIPMILIYNSFTAQAGSAAVAALVMVLAGLLFAAVAGYLVGIIGSSSNPISGLTLTTLLIAAVMMVALGVRGNPGVAAVLGVAAVVCCVAGVAGDMIQDWKVGHILGATPWRMEIGGMIGVTAAALTLVVPLALLHEHVPGGIGGENL
ncbi:MAG: oligopeptide transporter, OPT family, partial [candidate division KSB1 bacterium]|nr:oligopeptide transporter, OPT family [candidate division KSB1 bacterium]